MSASTDSARGKAAYFGPDFARQVEEFGGEVRLHGPWYKALGGPAAPGVVLERALTDGFLDRRPANFTPGWVLTLTADKGWALAVNGMLGPDHAKELNTLLRGAAEATVRPYAERPESRLGAAGKHRVRGDGLWAVGTELVSRNGDLHPHAHVVVCNAVLCPDGKWRAHASARQLYADQGLLNAAFQKHLADGVQRAYGMDLARHEAGFKLRDFPDDRVRAASSRAADIDRFCQEHGWTTPEQRQIAAYLTRPAKREFRLAERWAVWQAGTEAAVPAAADREAFFLRVRVSELGPHPLAARAAAHVLEAAAALAAGRGPFTANQLRAESLLRAVGDPGVGAPAVEAAVGRVLERPHLVGLWRGERPGGPVYHRGPSRPTRTPSTTTPTG